MTLRRSLLAAAALAGMLLAPSQGYAEAPKVLALITSPDPHVQAMAFVLLGQMRQQGASVEVMLCGTAGDLARKDPPAEPVLRPSGLSPAQMLGRLVQAGMKTEVCALYLPNAGIGPEGLAQGVTPAQPPEMARRMLAEGTKLMVF